MGPSAITWAIRRCLRPTMDNCYITRNLIVTIGFASSTNLTLCYKTILNSLHNLPNLTVLNNLLFNSDCYEILRSFHINMGGVYRANLLWHIWQSLVCVAIILIFIVIGLSKENHLDRNYWKDRVNDLGIHLMDLGIS